MCPPGKRSRVIAQQMAPAIFRGGGDLRPALRRALSTGKEAPLSPKERLRLHKLDLLWGRGRSVFAGEDDVFRVRWSVEILRRLGWGRDLRLLPVVVVLTGKRVRRGCGKGMSIRIYIKTRSG